MKTLNQITEEVRKNLKPRFRVNQYGALFHVNEYFCDNIINTDEFKNKDEAEEHCNLLNKQYKEEQEREIESISRKKFITQDLINNAENIGDLCEYCERKHEICCPLFHKSRYMKYKIKKIEKLSCKLFKLDYYKYLNN